MQRDENQHFGRHQHTEINDESARWLLNPESVLLTPRTVSGTLFPSNLGAGLRAVHVARILTAIFHPGSQESYEVTNIPSETASGPNQGGSELVRTRSDSVLLSALAVRGPDAAQRPIIASISRWNATCPARAAVARMHGSRSGNHRPTVR